MKKLLLIAAIFVCQAAVFAEPAAPLTAESSRLSNRCDEEPTLLFNDWFDDEGFVAEGTESKTSPSKRFSVEYLWAPPDTDAREKVLLADNKTGQKVVLGKAERGATSRWIKTVIGDLLVVKYLQDTHFSECFVIRPLVSESGALSFSVLYSISAAKRFPSDRTVQTFYPEITSIDPDGRMIVDLIGENEERAFREKIELRLWK